MIETPSSSTPSAHAAGEFAIGGEIVVNRLGFGAMRLTGEGIWGEPADLEGARETLRRLPSLGVNFIDTADSYGPFVSETLLHDVLHPFEGLLVATKGGLLRTGPGDWENDGKPAYLRQCVLMSLRRLGLERIDLWQLHRIDPDVPREEQFGVIAEMQKEGLIRHVGLSEVGVEEIEAAQAYFRVATVQNLYNLADRKHEAVVDYCHTHGIGFIPWFPLAAGDLAGTDSPFSNIAERLNATASQLALAWILARSPVMLPIPGTSRVDHVIENVGAASIRLSPEDVAAIDRLSKQT